MSQGKAREGPVSPDAFYEAAKVLDGLKRKKVIADWAVYGAVAYIFHEEPIETGDMDVFVVVKDDADYFLNVFAALREQGPMTHEAATFLLGGVPVQVFPTVGKPLWEDVVQQAVVGNIGDQPVKVASREHLIILALTAFRPAKDWGRIVQLYQRADHQKLRALLERFDTDGELTRRLQFLTTRYPGSAP